MYMFGMNINMYIYTVMYCVHVYTIRVHNTVCIYASYNNIHTVYIFIVNIILHTCTCTCRLDLMRYVDVLLNQTFLQRKQNH